MLKKRIKTGPLSPSLTDRVYERLFQAIATGEVPGETRLVAASLARQLGVSITPVRESLLRLAGENLVKPVPRVGYIVESMSATDLIDVFEARIGVERLLAKMALEWITPAEVNFLEKNLEESTDQLAQGKTDRMLELDTAFHQTIAQAARNRTLVSVHQLLIKRTYRFRCACLRVLNLAQVTRDGHAEIVRAFLHRDGEELDQAVLSHLGAVKDGVVVYLEQLRQEAMEPASVSL
jgi:DNA-binding GntR family transcriptional regulator